MLYTLMLLYTVVHTGCVICSGTTNRGYCEAVKEVMVNSFCCFQLKFYIFLLGKTHSPMSPLIKESNGKTGVKVSLRHL